MILVWCLIVLASIGFFAKIVPKLRPEPSTRDRSIAGCRLFWERIALPISDDLSSGTSEYDCLNRRMKALADEIRVKYGEPPVVMPHAAYHPLSKDVIASIIVHKGRPEMRISVQTLMDRYEQVKGLHKRWAEEFYINFAVAVLHEVEHFQNPLPDDRSFNALIINEDAAWANTCRYALVPLHDEGKPLAPFLEDYYRKWIECGSTTNAAWRSFITEQYEFFRQDADQPK